jgi:hypothetical protein
MPPTQVPIFSGATNEKACMKVMSNLKFKGECLSELHQKVNKSIGLIEDLIVKCPSDDTKMLLLQTLQNYNRGKCVAMWKEPVPEYTLDESDYQVSKKDKDGNIIYQKDKKGNILHENRKYELPINTVDWMVSITNSKTVRIHLKPEKVAIVKEQFKTKKDLVVY